MDKTSNAKKAGKTPAKQPNATRVLRLRAKGKPSSSNETSEQKSKKKTTAKRGCSGEIPLKSTLKYEAMWTHFDQLLKNSTPEDMIQINTLITTTIHEFLKEKKID